MIRPKKLSVPLTQRSVTSLAPQDHLPPLDKTSHRSNLQEYPSPMHIEGETQQQRPGAQSSQYYQQYVPYAGPFLHPRPTQIQSLAAVTPASTGSARKRPRVHNTTMPPFNHVSTPTSSFLTNTPPATSISPSFHHQRLVPAATPSYRSHYSQISAYPTVSHLLSPPSASIPSPYLAQSSGWRNEPRMADGYHHTARRPSGVQSNDFDFYNDELLSDHSDHRDGSVSPVNYAFPKRDSM